MNAEYMMVDPNELVIDMPLDDKNVKTKMESLAANGVIQPVTVWLQGMRIIDGFHRTEAARRLGWTAIPCHVIDCSEDAFWDARIQSARQHHAIESDRLTAWMVESWKQTPWGESLSMLEQAWTIIKRKELGYVRKPVVDERKSIIDWFKEKAHRWGIPEYEIIDKIRGIPSPLIRNRDIAADCDLPLEKVSLVLRAPDRGSNADEVGEWVKTEVAPKDSPQPFYDWLKEKRKNERERILAEGRIHRERREAFLRTEVGKAQAEKERLRMQHDSIAESLKLARGTVEQTDYWLTCVPEAPAMLAEFAQFVADFAAEHFPGVEVAQPNPVSLDNARLRAENAKLRERIASLERALGSKQAAGEMLSNAIAWSSGDLER